MSSTKLTKTLQCGVVGKGAMGLPFVHGLHKVGHHVSIITKLSSINTKTVSSQESKCDITYYPMNSDMERSRNIPLLYIDDDSDKNMDNSLDLIIVPTKSFQIIQVLKQLNRKNWYQNSSKYPIIILFHNGIVPWSQITESINSTFPVQHIVVGTTSHGNARFDDDDEFTIRQRGIGKTWIGYRTEQNIKNINCIYDIKDITSNIIDTTYPKTEWFDNIDCYLFYKLAINCCINAICTIYNLPNGGFLNDKKLLNMSYTICKEVVSVYKEYYKQNISDYDDSNNDNMWINMLCDSEKLFHSIKETMFATKDNLCSMNRDIFYQRPTEIHEINGYITDLAKQYNIHVPVNQLMVEKIMEMTPN